MASGVDKGLLSQTDQTNFTVSLTYIIYMSQKN